MLFKKSNNHSKYIFWISVLFIWIICTLFDRIWWNFYSDTPSWDQADYLNSALEHAHALSFFGGDVASDFSSLLDQSPKIPPLASIINGALIALLVMLPMKRPGLKFWNGFWSLILLLGDFIWEEKFGFSVFLFIFSFLVSSKNWLCIGVAFSFRYYILFISSRKVEW